MMRTSFEIGEMVGIESGYSSGIWVRKRFDTTRSNEDDHIPQGSIIVILEIKEHDIKIIGNNGVIGWTLNSRLMKLC